MIGTFLAIFSWIIWIFLGIETLATFSVTATVCSPLLLLATLIVRAFGLMSLQRADKGPCPGVLFLVQNDKPLKWIQAGLVALPFLSIVVTIQASSMLLTALWLTLTGASVDLILLYIRTVHKYIDPHSAIKLMSELGVKDAENRNDAGIADKQVTLCDIGYRAIEKGSSRNALQAITGLGNILEGFYEKTSDGASESNKMRLGYISAFGLDQLESLFYTAIAAQMHPTATHVLTTLGSASISAAGTSPQTASQLLHSMGELATWALTQDHNEVCIKGSLTLTETAKMLVTDPKATQLDLSQPLLTAVGQLDDIAQKQYRHDRESDLHILTQPAQELKRAFSENLELKGRKDVRVALQAIDSLLSTFQNLQLVLNTVPPIPDVSDQAEKEKVPEPELPTDDDALQMYRDTLGEQNNTD